MQERANAKSTRLRGKIWRHLRSSERDYPCAHTSIRILTRLLGAIMGIHSMGAVFGMLQRSRIRQQRLPHRLRYGGSGRGGEGQSESNDKPQQTASCTSPCHFCPLAVAAHARAHQQRRAILRVAEEQEAHNLLHSSHVPQISDFLAGMRYWQDSAHLDSGWVCKDVAAVDSVDTKDPRMNDYVNRKAKSKQRRVSDQCS